LFYSIRVYLFVYNYNEMDKTFEGHRTKLISSHVPLMNFLCERERKKII